MSGKTDLTSWDDTLRIPCHLHPMQSNTQWSVTIDQPPMVEVTTRSLGGIAHSFIGGDHLGHLIGWLIAARYRIRADLADPGQTEWGIRRRWTDGTMHYSNCGLGPIGQENARAIAAQATPGVTRTVIRREPGDCWQDAPEAVPGDA